MNYSTVVFLINKNTRAMLCTYETGDAAPKTMFKTFDPDIKVGDLVVVPTNTRHNMTVCKVVEADVDVDFDSPVKIDWIVSTIDKAAYDQLLAQEEQAIQKIRSAEVRKKREALAASVLADSADEIKALPISGINVDPAPQA